jgi:hypothetical protein
MEQNEDDREVESTDIANGLTELLTGAKMRAVIDGIAIFLARAFVSQSPEFDKRHNDPLQDQIDYFYDRLNHFGVIAKCLKKEQNEKKQT